MTLRNAFEDVAQDSTVAAITEALAPLLQTLIDQIGTALQPQLAIPYARDVNGQLYVNLASGTVVVNATAWGNANTEPTYYSSGAPNSMDQREMQELQSEINFNNVRTQRWQFA